MLDLKFILSVKEHQILYKTNGKYSEAEEVSRINQWQILAKDFKFANGNEAEQKWLQLTKNYIQYLLRVDGKTFPYAKEMQFMQQYIMGANQDDDSQSDLELDENDLHRILYSDEEFDVNSVDCKLKKIKRKSCTEEGESGIAKREKHVEVQEIPTESCSGNVETASTNIISSPALALGSLSSLELIFLGYARELQKMPLALQVRTKRKISDIMDEAEMKMLEY